MERRALGSVGCLLCALICMLLGTGAWAEALSATRWVYPDTPEAVVLTVEADGTILFEEHAYTVERGEPFSYLKPAEDGLPELRCVIGADEIILYRQNEYARHAQDKGTGLPGAWLSTSGGSVFILGGDGLFMEDGVFTGSYTVDEQEHSFLLHYGELFEDTKCYYTLSDGHLIIEYPWKLIPFSE